ncbi:MAG TPA: GNAT family N-acetyltransferase [Thermodesulfovibrionales bacterium]|nr:GNAT family N-acetyltransferase [Thermodesulfovibrionales bacterium]
MSESGLKLMRAGIGGTVTVRPLHDLDLYWRASVSPLKWGCLFMLPPWLRVWSSHFGQGSKTRLYVVTERDLLLGAAPLLISGETAHLIGDSDLIDYSDFIVTPSREREFFLTLSDRLKREGISRLDMGRVRSDSAAFSCVKACSTVLDDTVSCEPVDELFEMDLPETWDGYLGLLSGRERHETRRKLRRLESAGDIAVRVIEEKQEVAAAMDAFMALFRANASEKVRFMTVAVESFFRSLAAAMAEAGLLKLFFLDLNGMPVAATMCFDYDSTIYLYNSGYDGEFSQLSAGLLGIVFSIRESIARGRQKFNFLRGSEPYKRRLGGLPAKLHHCEVVLK